MKCPLCGFEFDEREGAKACSACASLGGCGLIRCPNCSYEWPKEPAWLAKVKSLWRKDKNGAES